MADPDIADLEARLAEATAPPVDPVKRVDALNALAWELRGTEPRRGHALAVEARDLAIEHGYKLGQARAARTMGMTTSAEGLRDIFDYAQEAKRLFDEVGDGPGRAGSRDFLASLHEFIGDMAGGLELALDALGIARELGDPIRQGYALSSVGGILAASGQVDASVERLREALELFQSADNSQGVGTICARLMRVLKDAGRNDEALTYAAMDTANNDDTPRFSALMVMAEIAAERDESAEAERLYRAALETFTEVGARNVIGAPAQLALGRILIERGALDAAERELEDALSRVEDNPVTIVTSVAAHEALADLRERQGQLAPTIEHLREAQALREQIAQKDARNKLAQVEVRADMEAAKKDAAIHKLRFVELHDMQSKLVEAEKMGVLGRLAAGAAHELNTPLGVLRSNNALSATATERLLSLLRDDESLGAEAKKLATVLESLRDSNEAAMERLTAVARNFGRFTQLDQSEVRTFDVREGLDSALALLEPTLTDGIEIVRRFDDVPAIDGWPRELNHAFMTVLQNAAQAIDGAGTVTAETSAADGQVLVRIHDTGRGMSEDQAKHLFDVAWSEDGTRTRMRLGLSAAYSTMQKHGGTMEVESVLGEGTTMTFRFVAGVGRPNTE